METGNLLIGCKESKTAKTDVADGKKHYVCEYCNRMFETGQGYGGHKKAHLQNRNKRKQPEDVGMDLVSKYCKSNLQSSPSTELTLSQANYSEVKPREYICNICSKSFTSFQALGGHKSSRH